MKRSFLVTKDKVLNDKAPSEWKTALMSLLRMANHCTTSNIIRWCLNEITPKTLQEMINELIVWNQRYVVYKTQKK